MSFVDHLTFTDAEDTEVGPRDLPKTCHRCGARNLHWVPTGVRFALADNRGLHRCNTAASATEFDNVTGDDPWQ